MPFGFLSVAGSRDFEVLCSEFVSGDSVFDFYLPEHFLVGSSAHRFVSLHCRGSSTRSGDGHRHSSSNLVFFSFTVCHDDTAGAHWWDRYSMSANFTLDFTSLHLTSCLPGWTTARRTQIDHNWISDTKVRVQFKRPNIFECSSVESVQLLS